MKYVKLFEQFVNELNLIDEATLNEPMEIDGSPIPPVNESVLGFVAGAAALRVAYQFFRRRAKIKKMLATVTDPAKKEQLRKELETLKYDEVKAKEQVKQKEDEMKQKAADARRKLSPEEREQVNKDMAKKRKELDKAREKFAKEKQKFQGIV